MNTEYDKKKESKDYEKTRGSRDSKEKTSTKKTEKYDLLTEIKTVLQNKDELTPYVEPLLELIKEKNKATFPDEKLLKLELCYKKRMEKLKGPKKTAGTPVPC